MKESAGIIPFRINEDTGKLEFFVGHPGGYGWEGKNYWAFLKGHVESGESWQDAAIREFKEETGLSMTDCRSQMLFPLGKVRQNNTKEAIAFALHYPNIDPDKCFSNVIEDGVTPEIDKYRWIEYDAIKNMTHKTHLVFYEQIKKMVEESFSDYA